MAGPCAVVTQCFAQYCRYTEKVPPVVPNTTGRKFSVSSRAGYRTVNGRSCFAGVTLRNRSAGFIVA